MADTEDKEKAEKVAAARKRYEQLKKQKAKKATGTGTKKTSKDEKAEPSGDAAASATAPTTEESETAEKTAEEQEDDDAVTEQTAAVAATADGNDAATSAVDETEQQTSGTHRRGPSLSLQSQMRSSSFRQAAGTSPTGGGALKSPSLPPLSADGESVQEIYRKQAARIEALEKDNRRFEKEAEEHEATKAKLEEELEELRESRADVVASGANSGKDGQTEKLRAEILNLQRQNTQLSQQAKDKRRPSGNIPLSNSATEDLSTQLADKTSTIESLELDISNLRHSLSESEAASTTLQARVAELEASLQTAQDSAATAQRDTDAMRARLESATAADTDGASSAAADANRVALLTSDLHSAQRATTDAQTRAANLEKKAETLTTLHRESEARTHAQLAARTKEMERLRGEAQELRRKVSAVSNENARLRERRARGESTSSAGGRPGTGTSDGGDAGGAIDFAAGDDEAKRLGARVRALEAENSELRRGLWRERRRELQGDMPDGEGFDDGDVAVASPGFDDVDLSPTPTRRRRSQPYNAFGFTNIINTFTGRDSASAAAAAGAGGRRESGAAAAREKQASGFFGQAGAELDDGDDDGEFAFDEDAFRAAQEEQAKARLERVKEVKRGLNEWRGWRVDLVELRGGQAAGVFDV